MTFPPRTPFNLSADPEKDEIRDKDNAAAEHKMKLADFKPRLNLAPGGSMGIRQGLSPREVDQPAKRFALGKTGDLKREFKPIASKDQDHDKGHDRQAVMSNTVVRRRSRRVSGAGRILTGDRVRSGIQVFKKRVDPNPT